MSVITAFDTTIVQTIHPAFSKSHKSVISAYISTDETTFRSAYYAAVRATKCSTIITADSTAIEPTIVAAFVPTLLSAVYSSHSTALETAHRTAHQPAVETTDR